MKKNHHHWLVTLALALFLVPGISYGQDLDFDNIDKSDLENIIGDLSANFAHTTVSGGSALGAVFGFELGVVGGVTSTPGVDKLVKETDPNADSAALPHAGLLIQFSVPMGVTVEANLIPSFGSEDFKFSNTGIGVKWTMTDSVLSLPFNLALKGNMTKTELKFETVINNASTGNIPVDSKLEFSNTTMGLAAVISKNFLIFEPYFGFGFVNSDGDLRVDGTGSIFDTTLTTGQSAGAKNSGTHMFLGAELDLFFLKLGIEYAKIIDADRYTGKLAFSF
ncbi:MAG: hypothetical protein H6624_11880 [Bdellovibrionaceae bacterium]|nr:hypothetical protein [Bdellovibrionales bacterium]MCB9085040.1 hypothetical protein [Pseudobdellovibrionaceae bacterium]